MSRYPDHEPACVDSPAGAIELVIDARARDLGGFAVRRVLPSSRRRLVGPFVFFDHMGPASFAAGEGISVRPHPHIGLATLTYLFEGEILHRDSLGTAQRIRPGDVNWMVAGGGIVHSERGDPARMAEETRLHGVQCWIALPVAHEEDAPRFEHHPAATIPVVTRPGASLRVIAGEAYGARSPVGVLSPTLYVHAELDPGAALPLPDGHTSCAAYVIEGSIGCDGQRFVEGTMLVFRAGAPAVLHASSRSHVMLLGGAPLDGERHVVWNFVSSSRERIERAKQDWKEGRFPKVPGDEIEFIPFPDV
ncbi:pirin [Sorangium cellulosum]|uniref:Pirin n=1 Tax=Sorangium cellulosum TaxID=56 RepID=A0A2L0EZG6_SORCE|nr:pirin family protein [Sorangium cellulosum]AUX44673.1 pirin [Sorangium cellulosum]